MQSSEPWAAPLDIRWVVGFTIRYQEALFSWEAPVSYVIWYAKSNLVWYIYVKLEVKDITVKTASQNFPLLKWQRSIIILRVNEDTGRQAGPHAR